MKYKCIQLFFFFALFASNAQNSFDFFKTQPILDGTEPSWVQKMYSDNPNVAEVEDLFREYYQTHIFEKNEHTQNHKHWIRLVEPLLNEEGFIIQPTREIEDSMHIALKSNYQNISNVESVQTEWIPMGPFETYKVNSTTPISWHKNVYSIDQSATDSDILICGTEAGGVYKTSDKGANWALISKGEVFAGGNSAVKIHPADTNNFLVASNKRIYQSLDGGSTWTERHYTNGTGNEFEYSTFDDSTIFHTSTTGLFKSVNGGFTWTQVFSDKCWDIDFHPADSSIAYLLKSNIQLKRSELFRSKDGGNSWVLQDSGWYSPTVFADAQDLGGKIAVTPASPNKVYVALIGNAKSGDNGWIGVYVSNDTASTWSNPSGQDGGPYGTINGTSNWNVAAYSSGYHQGFFNFDLEASPSDSNKIWIATIRLSESSDGGQTFQSIGAANSNRLSDIHADVQDIEVIGNDIWIASDGGINYSNDELTSHTARNNGILAAHFWGFNTGWNQDSYTGGKYHDGTSGWYENYGAGKAYNIGGVEEASGYVHPIEGRKLLFRTHYSSSNTSVRTVPMNFGDPIIAHSDLPVRPNEFYSTAERSGVYFDPRYADHIYVGLENKIYKSTNGGASFNVIYTFPQQAGMIYEIEISRSNPDVLYAVYNKTGGYWDNCEIWKSINGGKNWSKTTSNPQGNNKRFRISIHPQDANKIWACTPRGANGGKVSYSSNGGSTWTNKTTSTLDGENLTDILYQGGSNDVVYVTSQNGVFYWDATTSNWINYSLGLPLIAKSLQINPFYRDAELRLASSGRGVWRRTLKDTLFNPIAQPITYTDTIYCSRDTTYFDCYSILRHEGAQWYWNISPQPQFISSDSIRNPKVVLGVNGSYSVSLTITDAQGNTSTKTIQNMVTVFNQCEPDTIPGNAVLCQTNNGYVQTSSLGLTDIDSLTISAWIKPNGIQNNYSGIVFSDSPTETAGLNISTGNLLAYHWPGGQWWWNSGLVVPTDEWSHVAMVVTPNGITLYLNGVGSTHSFSVSQIDIEAMKIGSYKGWGSRNFNGEIDEVCIWKKALSQSELRKLKHLTRTGNTPYTDKLFAYYQFNLPQTTVLDKIGSHNAFVVGAAQKVVSTAPVGGGNSDLKTISGSGTYHFPNSETDISFGSITPNNQVVVSRLNVLPDSLPNTNPHTGHYWILNNYGNQNFSALDSVKFKSNSGVSFGNHSKSALHKRQENEHLNNWIQTCGAFNKNGGTYNYNSSCNLTNGSQFFIQSLDSNAINGSYNSLSVSTEICGYDSIFLGGDYQNTAGTYVDTILTSFNTADIKTTSLSTINIDTSVTYIGFTIQSNQNNAKYQWLDCTSGFSILPGDTLQTFTAPGSGSWAVEIRKDGCTDTSMCISTGNFGFTQNNLGDLTKIYPNPTNGLFWIELNKIYPQIEIHVFSEKGDLINTYTYSHKDRIELNINKPSGLYFIEIIASDGLHEIHSILKN